VREDECQSSQAPYPALEARSERARISFESIQQRAAVAVQHLARRLAGLDRFGPSEDQVSVSSRQQPEDVPHVPSYNHFGGAVCCSAGKVGLLHKPFFSSLIVLRRKFDVPDGQQELAFRDHRKEWGRQWDTLDNAKDHEQLFAYILAEGEVELRNKLLSDPLGSKSGSTACTFYSSRFSNGS
jgi:hypothetical protein